MLFIFDMGGVVTKPDEMPDFFNWFNLTPQEFFTLCTGGSSNIWNAFESGKLSIDDFWSAFNQRSLDMRKDIPEVHGDIYRQFFHPELNAGTVAVIEALKKKHRVVCGTNTNASHFAIHEERGDYALFHETYASNKMGVVKPSTAFFEHILKAEGVRAEDAFFTDDSAENCAAASSLGIHAIRFTDADSLFREWEQWMK